MNIKLIFKLLKEAEEELRNTPMPGAPKEALFQFYYHIESAKDAVRELIEQVVT